MTAVAAAAIASVGIGAYGLYSAEKQKSDAKKLAEKNTFTPQKAPTQLKTATNLAAQNYYNGMPGTAQAQNIIRGNAGNSFFNGAQGASSGGDLLDLAARINQGENTATNDLAAKAANYKSSALGAYTGALNNEAGWEDKLYKNNTLDPYLRTANTAAAMEGAGNINEYNSINQIANSGLAYAQTRSPSTKTNPATMGEKYGTNPITPVPTGTPVNQGLSTANIPAFQQGATYQPNTPYGTNWQPFDAASAMANASLKKRGF